MRTYLTIQFLSFLLIVFFSFNVKAQDNCATTLKKAEQLYDEGKIENMAKNLQSCLKNGFTKAQKIRAYELIIQSYLVDYENELAEKYMMSLLKVDPHDNPADNIVSTEFTELFNSIQTRPIFSIGFVGGANISQIDVIEQYGVHDLNNISGKYSSNTGFQFGLKLLTALTKDLEIELSPKYVVNMFDYSLNNINDFSNTSYTESQTRFDIPVALVYKYTIKDFVPFVSLGFCPGFVLSDEIEPLRTYTNNSHANITDKSIDVFEQRKQLYLAAQFGLGLRYTVDKGYVFFNALYNRGIENQVLENERYSNQDKTYKYFIVDDDYYLSSMSFSVGYVYSFYKAKRKKTVK